MFYLLVAMKSRHTENLKSQGYFGRDEIATYGTAFIGRYDIATYGTIGCGRYGIATYGTIGCGTEGHWLLFTRYSFLFFIFWSL